MEHLIDTKNLRLWGRIHRFFTLQIVGSPHFWLTGDVQPHWALKPRGGGDVLVPSNVYVDSLAVEIPSWQGWAKAAKEKLERMAGSDHFPQFGPTKSSENLA